MVALFAPLQFPVIILQVMTPLLELSDVATSSYAKYASEGLVANPPATTFNPAQFVKKEDFKRYEDKNEVFMEQTTK